MAVRQRWAVTGLLLLAVLPYANSLANGFVWDDKTQLLANPYLADFHHWRQILTTPVWSFQGPDASGYFRPLMLVVFLLLLRTAGAHAWVFHLASVGLHAAVVLAVYAVADKLWGQRRLAWVAAALFAVHPMHSEAVDWIAASADLELALFFLLAFYCFLKLEAPRPGWWAAGMVACTALALLAKEPALMLAPLATVFEHGFRDWRQETPWRVKAARYGPLWLLSGAYLLYRHAVLGAVLSPRAGFGQHLWTLPLSALALVGQYAAKLLVPYPLSAYYLFQPQPAHLLPWAAVGALLLLSAAWLWARHRGVPGVFALLWLLATLVPVLNPNWLAANAFAERYAYLPSAGFCWMAAAVALQLWAWSRQHRRWRLALAAAGAELLVLGAVVVAARNPVWHDDDTLYRSTLRQHPDAYWLRQNLGALLWARHDVTGAETQWRLAVRAAPAAGPIWANLGMLELDQRHYAEAADELQRALRLNPGDGAARRNLAAAELGWAQGELAAGRYDTAAAGFRQALGLSGGLTARLGLGLVYWRSGHPQRALAAWRDASTAYPRASQPHYLLALYLAKLRRAVEAQREFALAIRLDPGNTVGINAYQQVMGKH